jgi:hypothetical protein
VPIFKTSGVLIGAVNMLVDSGHHRAEGPSRQKKSDRNKHELSHLDVLLDDEQ